MALSTQDLRAFLIADPAVAALVGNRVEKNKSHKKNVQADRIVYFRDSSETLLRDLQGCGTPEQRFTVECISRAVDTAEEIGDAVRDRSDGYAGPYGSSQVQAIFVEDTDDNYIPRGVDMDAGWHVVALQLQVIGV